MMNECWQSALSGKQLPGCAMYQACTDHLWQQEDQLQVRILRRDELPIKVGECRPHTQALGRVEPCGRMRRNRALTPACGYWRIRPRHRILSECGAILSKRYKLAQIAQQMVTYGDAGTFAALYGALTSHNPAHAWPSFLDNVNTLPGGVNSDNPFG
jgi:hypothetical protein